MRRGVRSGEGLSARLDAAQMSRDPDLSEWITSARAAQQYTFSDATR